MDEGEKATVFISYNNADKETARALAMFLAAEDIGVRFDAWEVNVGDSIIDFIEDGLDECTHFVLIWSANAEGSGWVNRELKSQVASAIETGNPKIIPVCLDDTPLPVLLNEVKYHRYQGGTEEDRESIIRSVKSSGPEGSFIRAVVRKYNELVRNDAAPIPYDACPECGNTELSGTGGSHRGYNWVRSTCTECGWSMSDLV